MRADIFNGFLKYSEYEIRGNNEWCIYSDSYESIYFFFSNYDDNLRINYLDNFLTDNQKLRLRGAICNYLDELKRLEQEFKNEMLNAPDDLEHGLYGYGY